MTAQNLHSRAVDTLARLLEKHTGQQLSEARRWRVETSLRPLLRNNGLRSLDDLVSVLGRAPAGQLFDQTIDLMLNHESSFFRDLTVFQSLETAILPEIRERNASERRLRIWCAGCSTGKEAYSIAMALKHMGGQWDGWRISILGTDVSPIAIEEAKRGRYSQMEMQRGLAINDLLRWFTPAGEHWQIKDEIREMVHFQTDNLLEPRAVSGEFDLILCRNVLFYFQDQNRQTAFKQIVRHAHKNSYLVLGAGETLVGHESSFMPCPKHGCVYKCREPDRPIPPAGGNNRG
jgi:chemotaxis protein methyltransferase CheR